MLAQHFERFVQVYDERFAPTRGSLPPGAQEAVNRYLDRGIFAKRLRIYYAKVRESSGPPLPRGPAPWWQATGHEERIRLKRPDACRLTALEPVLGPRDSS